MIRVFSDGGRKLYDYKAMTEKELRKLAKSCMDNMEIFSPGDQYHRANLIVCEEIADELRSRK